MGRPTRIQFPGACYYVRLKGNHKDRIFVDDEDRAAFLRFLETFRKRAALRVYAYALLPSEAHLLLETQEANLSEVMQGFNTAYTKYFSKRHNRSGHVFGGRYRALLVEKPTHLTEVSRYIHLFPLRHEVKDDQGRTIRRPWRFKWSSCLAYCEAKEKSWLDTEDVLMKFGRGRMRATVRYLTFIKNGMKAKAPPELTVVKGQFVGSSAFAAQMGAHLSFDAVAGETRDKTEDAQRILREVVLKHGIDEAKVLGRSRWASVAAARKEAVFRAWKEAGMGVSELGRMFQRTPGAISQMIKAAALAEEAGRGG